jgi:hypothetical protein
MQKVIFNALPAPFTFHRNAFIPTAQSTFLSDYFMLSEEPFKIFASTMKAYRVRCHFLGSSSLFDPTGFRVVIS